MILYHYTSLGHLPLILRSGVLDKGGVLLGHDGLQTINATWLSTNPSPERDFGLGMGQLIELPSDVAEEMGRRWTESVDKRAVRITVRIPSTERRLKHWIRWVQGRLGEEMLAWHIDNGGGRAEAECHYIHLGPIPRAQFTRIEVRGNMNEWIEATEEMIACIQPHETDRSYRTEPHPLETLDT